MNSRLSSCFATFSIVLIGTILICVAAIMIPQILTPSAAAPSAEPVNTLQPAVPSTSGTACPNGDCANACVSQLNSVQQNGGSSEAGPQSAGGGRARSRPTVLVTYPVSGDQLGAPKVADHVPAGLSGLQDDTDTQQKIWDYFAAIIPAGQRADLIYYIVATDGKGGMLASVEHFSGPSELMGATDRPGRCQQATRSDINLAARIWPLADPQ